MNRRGFFGLIAALALMPKRAVGKAYPAGFKIPRPGVVRMRSRHDVFAKRKTYYMEWIDTDCQARRFPPGFKSSPNRWRMRTPLGRKPGGPLLIRHRFQWEVEAK